VSRLSVAGKLARVDRVPKVKELNDFQRNLLDIEILSNLRFGSLEIRDTSVTRVSTFELRSRIKSDTMRIVQHLRRCEDLKLLRCLIRPSLRHEKHRSFLFSR
jgi:hypothetical protein